MSIEITVPVLGESVTEGVLTRWLKAVGDRVDVDEPLFEISTDKVDTEVPSPVSGVLRQLLAEEDDTVEVGAAVALLDATEPSGSASEGIAPRPVTTETPAPGSPLPATPATAPPDTPRHAPFTMSEPPISWPVVGPAHDYRPKAAAAHIDTAIQMRVPAQVEADRPSLRGTTIPMSRLRRVIAQRMLDSLSTSAQLTSVVEVDVTAVAKFRDVMKHDFLAREGIRLSFLPFFARAALDALKQNPPLNAVINDVDETITYHDHEHLAIAVETAKGLLAPVIRDAGDLSVTGLAKRIADLADRARANQISGDELGGGTFTVTNTGSRGALFDTPIINQPQVAILGTGSVVRKPVVLGTKGEGESIAIRDMAFLALTYDHRLVDGADAARYLGDVRRRLESGAFDL